jgi:probable rRNA maturation factor
MIEVQFYEGLDEMQTDLAEDERRAQLTAKLAHAAEETLRMAGAAEPADLTLVLSNDEQLHQLNRQFLEIDAPTDVLSFPAGDTDPDSDTLYLGDVILSYPRAAQQAAAAGHTTDDELQLLVVHGVLHLLGHDHAEPEEKDTMWSIQARILDALGLSLRP